jgi:hypothetical protein
VNIHAAVADIRRHGFHVEETDKAWLVRLDGPNRRPEEPFEICVTVVRSEDDPEMCEVKGLDKPVSQEQIQLLKQAMKKVGFSRMKSERVKIIPHIVDL